MRRFHLLSYLAGILTIGILMGVNIRHCRVTGTRYGLDDRKVGEQQDYGFPFNAYTRRGTSISQKEFERLREESETWANAARVWESNPTATVHVNETQIMRDGARYVSIHATEWIVTGIVLNVMIVLVYVYLVMTFFEAMLLRAVRVKTEANA